MLKQFGEFGVPGPSVDVIEILREWTARAERGEIVGVAIAGSLQNGGISTEWRQGASNIFSLIGASDYLKHRMLEALNK